jgi:threonine dehydratase
MDIFEDTRSIMEPAGALALAGLRKWVERDQVRDKTLVAINSGANINFDRLRHVAERAELGEHREALLAVTIPERPGSFRQFCETLGERSITEFNYRFADEKDAHVFVGIKLSQGDEERRAIIETLTAQHYPVVDMTNNEMAKIHVRYMVGGRAPRTLQHELLYRFEFPERPGALLQFLTHMGQGWNISLFHYRNHGAAYGRVLVGIQVPPGEVNDLHHFLDKVGYPYWSEQGNPAYDLFLGS